MPAENTHPDNNRADRIRRYITATRAMQRGEFEVELPADGSDDDLGRLGSALQRLAITLEREYRQLQHLEEITSRANAGLLLDDILDQVYADFRPLIPYTRLGLALLDDDGHAVRAHYARSESPRLHLKPGYSTPLSQSLQAILQTGEPRILNDLDAYLRAHPDSASTRLIVKEGIRASFTCPLITNGVPVGFLFFSHTEPDTYTAEHSAIYRRIAEQLSVIVEKGRMISELAAQKTAIEEQNAELRRLSDLKNTLLGIAAHDLRSPIGHFKLVADYLMSRPELDEETRHAFLEDLRGQSRQMSQLINNLLDISQLESGKLELERWPLAMADFLEEVVNRHRTLAAPKSIRILLAPVPDGTAHADRQRLRQVMDNLIANAVKFSPNGTTVHIHAAREAGNGWRVTVQDEGPGITPQDRERLFQEFARLSARPTGGEKSTGLGLAITRRIVQAHGGQIGVESAPGAGAAFWFTLPDRTA